MSKNRIIVYDFTWDDDMEFGVWIGKNGEPEVLVECMVVYYDFDTDDELEEAYSSLMVQDEPHEDDSPRRFGDDESLADYLLVDDIKLGLNDFVLMPVKGKSKHMTKYLEGSDAARALADLTKLSGDTEQVPVNDRQETAKAAWG